MLYHSRQILDIETAESTRQIIFEFEWEVTRVHADVNPASYVFTEKMTDVKISHDNGGTFLSTAFLDIVMIIGEEPFGEMVRAAKTAIRDSNDYAKDWIAANANG